MKNILLVVLAACGGTASSNTSNPAAPSGALCVTGPIDTIVTGQVFPGSGLDAQLFRDSFHFLGDEIAYADPRAGAVAFAGHAGLVFAVSKNGGTPRTAYTPPQDHLLLSATTNGSKLFVMIDASRSDTESTRDVYRVEADGSGTMIASAPSGTTWDILSGRFIAADETDVYLAVTAGTENQIVKAPVAGGASTVMTHVTHQIVDAQKVGDAIVYLDASISGALHRVDAAGDVQVTSASADCLQMFADATGIYCARLTNTVKLDLMGASPVVLLNDASSPQSHVAAVDSGKVYFGFAGSPSRQWPIERLPVAGGTLETIACGRNAVVDIQVDATHVYWTERPDTGSDLTLYRTPK